MSWAFVVLNWNGREDTLRCLASLRAVRGEHRVYVADNGSADGSAEAIRAAHPEAVLIENGANLGYAGGNNPAIARAIADGATWVVLLNNDARPDPGVLDAFAAAAAREPGAGVLAGMLLFEDGRVQWAGQRLGLRSGYSGRPDGYGRPLAEVDLGDGAPRPVARGVGALMAVSRAAIDAAGTFDDDLFAYVEDVDWCLRIRAAGFGCLFVPAARAVHALSASTGGDSGSTATLYYGARNTIVICERHLPLNLPRTWLRRATIALTFALRAATVQRSRAAFAAVASGVRDGIARRLGPRS
jgi:hypothetical protein